MPLRTLFWAVASFASQVFFEPGSAEQLMFGLLMCFLTVAFLAYYRPYRDATDTTLQIVCLIEVLAVLDNICGHLLTTKELR